MLWLEADKGPSEMRNGPCSKECRNMYLTTISVSSILGVAVWIYQLQIIL